MTAFLALVLATFSIFIAVLGWASVWSRQRGSGAERPSSHQERHPSRSPPNPQAG
jgi:hypothetical protein